MGSELTMRQCMRRDRSMHELGLGSIEALPPAVLVDTLQQLCLAAHTSDATMLPAFLAKQLRASAMVPELEKFVDAVCEVRSAQRLLTDRCMRPLTHASMRLSPLDRQVSP